MKPFNLEEYLANPNRKVVTRDGHKVTRFLCTNINNIFPIIAAIEVTNNTEIVKTYTKEGTYFEDKTKHPYDLFFAPEKHEGWVNVIRDMVHNEVYCGNMIYASKEEAERIANNATLATAKIEWEE